MSLEISHPFKIDKKKELVYDALHLVTSSITKPDLTLTFD
jgi:hypothetical protein